MRVEGEALMVGRVGLTLGAIYFDTETLARLEAICDRFSIVAGGVRGVSPPAKSAMGRDAGRLVVEALEARLEVLEAVGK